MTNSPLPWMTGMETAPKNERLLLLYADGRIVCGRWNTDQYKKKPRPFWNNDNSRIFGLAECRKNPPIAWMDVNTVVNAHEKMRKALEFYADRETWCIPFGEEWSAARHDAGKIARAALVGEG